SRADSPCPAAGSRRSSVPARVRRGGPPHPTRHGSATARSAAPGHPSSVPSVSSLVDVHDPDRYPKHGRLPPRTEGVVPVRADGMPCHVETVEVVPRHFLTFLVQLVV